MPELDTLIDAYRVVRQLGTANLLDAAKVDEYSTRLLDMFEVILMSTYDAVLSGKTAAAAPAATPPITRTTDLESQNGPTLGAWGDRAPDLQAPGDVSYEDFAQALRNGGYENIPAAMRKWLDGKEYDQTTPAERVRAYGAFTKWIAKKGGRVASSPAPAGRGGWKR